MTTELSAEYWSCKYLETGLSLSYSSIRACAIVHHNTGEPELLGYSGGEIFIDDILRSRDSIISQNQTAERHPNCLNCPNLTKRQWERYPYPVYWLGITAWLGCNLNCSYCWLEWADWSPRHTPGKKPLLTYDIRDTLLQLLEKNYLAPNAVVDWGGGGEPLLMPHFDDMLMLLSQHGTTQWLHTNGTRLPVGLKDVLINADRIHVLCSIDAGSPSTYQAIKGHNFYDQVWQNLEAYMNAGAKVTVKYIMQPLNCSRQEIRQFVEAAYNHGKLSILGDFDYRSPDLAPEICEGLAYLQLLADKNDLGFSLKGLGQHSYAKGDIARDIEAYFPVVYYDTYLYPLKKFPMNIIDWGVQCMINFYKKISDYVKRLVCRSRIS